MAMEIIICWRRLCNLCIYSFILLTGGEKFGGFSSLVLYSGYSAVISLLVFLCCGSIGFISSLIFVRLIYGQIKID